MSNIVPDPKRSLFLNLTFSSLPWSKTCMLPWYTLNYTDKNNNLEDFAVIIWKELGTLNKLVGQNCPDVSDELGRHF